MNKEWFYLLLHLKALTCLSLSQLETVHAWILVNKGWSTDWAYCERWLWKFKMFRFNVFSKIHMCCLIQTERIC